MATSVGPRWIQQGIKCPQCRLKAFVRGFSIGGSRSALRPESPKFIEIPQPRQPRAVTKRAIKGTLPVPRTVFHKRSPYKTTDEYLAATAAHHESKVDPVADSSLDPSSVSDRRTLDASRRAWKQQMASLRRENLGVGLRELYAREEARARFVNARLDRRRKQREDLLTQPAREDERLTSPSITPAVRALMEKGQPQIDPDREARLVEKRARYEAHVTARADAQRDATHTLYMHARDFITTEAQLDETIEREFSASSSAWSDRSSDNVWTTAPPKGMQEMLNEAGKFESGRAESSRRLEQVARLTQERLKRVAGELTGGRL